VLTTSERVKAVALKVLETEGPEAVSMRRIAKAVRITPMAIYHHFESRTALLDAVVAEEFTLLEQEFAERELSGSLEQQLIRMLLGYVNYALRRPRVFDYLFAQAREGARQYPRDFRAGASPTLNRIAELVRRGINEGYLERGDEWEIAMVLWAHVHGFVMLFRANRFALTEGEFRALVTRSIKQLLHGLAAK
jgi:AcrR family transcriptional regulator